MSNEIAKCAILPHIESIPLNPTLALNGELYLNSTYTTLYCKDTGGVVHTLTGGSGGGSVTQGDINDAITTHSNETNPHTNYQLKSEKNSANGYVGLSVNKRIIFDSRSDGVNDTTSYFVNDNTLSRTYTFPNKTGTVALLSDINDTNINPTDYQLKSEKNEANGYVGIAADRRIPIRNITDTFTSYIRNDDDASYVYTLPSKTGVIALQESKSFFTAGLTDNITIVNNDAYNTILFNKADIDNLSEFNTNTGVFTAQQNGYYVFIVNIICALTSSIGSGLTDTTSPDTIVRIIKNSSSLETITDTLSGLHQGTSPIVYLNANDTVKCEIRYGGQISTALESVFVNSTFSGYRVA